MSDTDSSDYEYEYDYDIVEEECLGDCGECEACREHFAPLPRERLIQMLLARSLEYTGDERKEIYNFLHTLSVGVVE